MLAAAVFSVILAQAPATDPALAERLKAAGSRDIVDVPDTVVFLEEAGLPPDVLRSQADVQPSTANRSTLSGTALTDMTDRGQRGMRLLAITLAPGQKLAVKLLGQNPEKIQLSLAPPAQPGPMSGEIGLVNKRPALNRTRLLEIRNVLNEPFTVLLRVTGFLGYPYKLDIQRSR